MTTTVTSEWSDPVAFTVKTQTWPLTEQAKLLAGDPAGNDQLGSSISASTDGTTVLVGALSKTGTAGASQGAAYVYTRSGGSWSQQAKLLASDPAASDHFGTGVALSADGNTAIVGAYSKAGTYTNQGAAYVFTRSGSTWTQQAKLLVGDPAADDQLGRYVTLSSDGNTAVVGAHGKAGSAGANQGAAYVFTRSGTTWTQQAKLLAGDPAASDVFGYSVSLSSDGNMVLVGAVTKTGPAGASQGAGYVFVRSNAVWTQQAKLLVTDPAAGDRLGGAVALSADGNTALLAAGRKTGTAGTLQGAAYIFIHASGAWTQQAKLLASDPAASDQFGYNVALSADGNTASIGTYGKAGTYSNQGAVYLYTRSSGAWSQKMKALASDPASGDLYGFAVCLSGDGIEALIGALSKTGTYSAQGAVYVLS